MVKTMMNHMTRLNCDMILSIVSFEASLRVSNDLSFEREKTGANDDLLVLAWEVKLSDGNQPSEEVEASANYEANIEHKSATRKLS